MNSRTAAIIFLVIVLIITWILMSSITPLIIKTSESKSNNVVNIVSVSKSQMPGIGLGTGLFGSGFGINGLGTGLFGSGFGFSGIGFGLHGFGKFGTLAMLFINEPIISPLPPHITQPAISLTFSNALMISPVFSWSTITEQPVNMGSEGGGGGGSGGSSGEAANGFHGINSMNNEVVKTVVIKIFLPCYCGSL
ncbi:hypothetical protein [Vulcanisaeta sp. JCM 16159]|uniref:hypothetical protein n=1 Tax=Vulcanisaeta sp. JCM 16159 TaxID=1295371 RepID=UPI0006D25181|nr:hypothetical protein [Vulcanisaeta sp. JCM 16159]